MDFDCAPSSFLERRARQTRGLLTNEATQFDPIGGNPRLSSEEEWSLGLAPPALEVSRAEIDANS